LLFFQRLKEEEAAKRRKREKEAVVLIGEMFSAQILFVIQRAAVLLEAGVFSLIFC